MAQWFFLFLILKHCLFIFDCMQPFSSCGEWGLLSSCGAQASHCGGFSCCGAQALEHVASVVWPMSSRVCGLSSCDARAWLSHSRWILPRPGIKPVSSALAGVFLTTESPGKPRKCHYFFLLIIHFVCVFVCIKFVDGYLNYFHILAIINMLL